MLALLCDSCNTPNFSWGIFKFSLRDDNACPSPGSISRRKWKRDWRAAPPLRPKLKIPQLKLGVLQEFSHSLSRGGYARKADAHPIQDVRLRKRGGTVILLTQRNRFGGTECQGIKQFFESLLHRLEMLLTREIPSSAIDAYTRAFTLTKQLGVEKKEDVKTAKESIHQFNATLTQTQKDMASLGETVATAPRATTQLNRAKKRTVSILDRLDEEFTKASNLSSEMEKLFDQF
jgi:chromosome segregation ATPase